MPKVWPQCVTVQPLHGDREGLTTNQKHTDCLILLKVLYTSCLFYPLCETTSHLRPLWEEVFLKRFHCYLVCSGLRFLFFGMALLSHWFFYFIPNRLCHLVYIAGATALVPSHTCQVTVTLYNIPGTRIFHLGVPGLQMSCSDVRYGTRAIISVIATRVTCGPFTSLFSVQMFDMNRLLCRVHYGQNFSQVLIFFFCWHCLFLINCKDWN